MFPSKVFGTSKGALSSSTTTSHPHSLRFYIGMSIIGGLTIATIATRDATPFSVVLHWIAELVLVIHKILVWIPQHDYLEKISSSIDTFANNL
jgi:hypothetical protein